MVYIDFFFESSLFKCHCHKKKEKLALMSFFFIETVKIRQCFKLLRQTEIQDFKTNFENMYSFLSI